MGAASHLDEKDGLPSEMTVKLNSTLGYTGAYDGNSIVSVKLLQIYTDLNHSRRWAVICCLVYNNSEVHMEMLYTLTVTALITIFLHIEKSADDINPTST